MSQMNKRTLLEAFLDEEEIEHLKRIAASWNAEDAKEGNPARSTWKSVAQALAVTGLRERLKGCYSEYKSQPTSGV